MREPRRDSRERTDRYKNDTRKRNDRNSKQNRDYSSSKSYRSRRNSREGRAHSPQRIQNSKVDKLVKKLSGKNELEYVERKKYSDSGSSRNDSQSPTPKDERRDNIQRSQSSYGSAQSQNQRNSEESQSRRESAPNSESSKGSPHIKTEVSKVIREPEQLEVTAAPSGSGLFKAQIKKKKQIELNRSITTLVRPVQLTRPDSRPLQKKNSLRTFEVYEYQEPSRKVSKPSETRAEGGSLLSRIQKKPETIAKSSGVDIRSRIIKKPRQY